MTPDQLILENIKLVKFLAGRLKLRNKWCTMRDLEGYGFIGLCHAARNWDGRSSSFSNYASVCIRGQMIRGYKQESLVRVPDYINGLPPERLRENYLDIDSVQIMKDPKAERNKINIWPLLACLHFREYQIVRSFYFGPKKGGNGSYAEVGRKFGLSRERIRQIIARAIRKMEARHRLLEKQP